MYVVMKFSKVSHGGIENRKDWEEKTFKYMKRNVKKKYKKEK